VHRVSPVRISPQPARIPASLGRREGVVRVVHRREVSMQSMGGLPRVSVVIPTYNRAHTVGDAVASVLAQRFEGLEVIVVDDGSTDGTRERLAEVRDGRLRYVMGRHAGVAAARNLGVKHARGELIAFLDSDDLWRPDKLASEVAFLERHPEADAVFTDLEKLDGGRSYPSFMRETAVFAEHLRRRGHPESLLLSTREMRLILLEEVPVKPSALTVRRRAFEQAGAFDETWSSSEDWEFLLRFARAHRLGYIDRPLAVLRVGADSLHRVDQARGERAMIRRLLRERATLRGDAEALAAVRRGLVSRVKHFGWHYVDSGRRGAAAVVFLRGFMATLEPGLLGRAGAALLPWAMPTEPRGIRSAVRARGARPAPRSTA
jgi:glycosyltransferase involved in cell wall biosynthesis